jgi:hypothetical protein
MASRAYRGRRVALAQARGMNAAFVLLECVFVALAARLGPLDRILARALDVALRGRMALDLYVCMAAAASVRLVHRLCVRFPGNVQGQRLPILEILFHALGRVAAEALLVRLRQRIDRAAGSRGGR